MFSPRPVALTMIPIAWTPGTNGPLRAPVVVAPISKIEHFDAYRGKLAGKIVMISLPGDGSEPTKPAFERYERQRDQRASTSLISHSSIPRRPTGASPAPTMPTSSTRF